MAFIQPAFAQPETATIGGWDTRVVAGQLGVGGLGNNTVTIIDRAEHPISMQVMRFNDGPPRHGPHEINLRTFCRDGPQDTGITTCLVAETETRSAANNGTAAAGFWATRYSSGSIRAFSAWARDRSRLDAADSEGVFALESGIMTRGPEDYRHSRLGKRQGIRFVGKSTCGKDREGGVPPCPPGEGFAEIGTGIAVMTHSGFPTVTIGTAFAVEETNGAGRIERGFRCDISGTCLEVEGNPLWAMRLNGSDILLRVQDGTPITLRGEIAKLKRKIARLQRRVMQLEARQ